MALPSCFEKSSARKGMVTDNGRVPGVRGPGD